MIDIMNIQIQALHFDEHTARQLFHILKLRQDIFFVEENIIYPDLDDMDEDSIHVFATTEKDNKTITVSYARVYFDPVEKHVKVGRVATASAYRGLGFGGKIMRRCCEVARDRFKASEVWLDAQLHAVGFYKSMGFQVVSDVFMEAGIEHVRMIWRNRFICFHPRFSLLSFS